MKRVRSECGPNFVIRTCLQEHSRPASRPTDWNHYTSSLEYPSLLATQTEVKGLGTNNVLAIDFKLWTHYSIHDKLIDVFLEYVPTCHSTINRFSVRLIKIAIG
jgi:hypothetical protein